MKRFGHLALTMLLAGPAAVHAAEIAAEQTAPDRYRLTVAASSAEEARRLQNALSQRAASLCGAKPYWFGRYSFVASRQITGQPKPAAPMTFVQNIGCGGQSPPPPGKAEPMFDAVPGDDQAIVAATKAWFALAEGGDQAAAYRALAPELGAPAFDVWQRSAADTAAKSGKPLLRNIYKITWYRNPSGARPGLYAAADFENRFETVAARCGYIIWYKAPDAKGFVITRIEEGTIERAVADRMSPADLDAVRAQMRCPPLPRS